VTPTIDAKQFCSLTGYTDPFHRRIAKEGWFPEPIRGKYQAVAAITGMFKYLRQRTDDPIKKKNGELKNDILQHALAVKRRDYIKSTDVQRDLTRAIVAFRTRILTIPDAQAPRLALTNDPHEIKEVLRTEIIDALKDLARHNYATEEPDPAPAKP
jgi:hypothetical protein